MNRNVDGATFVNQSVELCWQGLKGPQTIAFMGGADKIKAKFLISQMDLEKLDTSKVYTLDGRRVLISEMVIHYCEGSHISVDVVIFVNKIG